jgi:predicted AAA+ superfamily ATPase
MDSMTLSETSPQKNGLKEIQRYLQHGGMPGVCFLRDAEQVRRYWDEWIETTCYRDLLEISKGRLNSDIAFRVLELTATLERPTAAEMANKLRTNARRIQNHLEGLLSLFLIRKWEPVEEGVGKCMYLPFDCGLASHFGANLSRLWQVWFAHARVNAARQVGKKDSPLGFFLTPRGSFADFIDSKVVHVFNEEASVPSRLLIRLRALEKNFPDHQIEFRECRDGARLSGLICRRALITQ